MSKTSLSRFCGLAVAALRVSGEKKKKKSFRRIQFACYRLTTKQKAVFSVQTRLCVEP